MSTPAYDPSVSQCQSNVAALKRLLEDPPRLHRPKDHDPSSEEEMVSWGIEGSFLKLMVEMVTPGDRTIEIGSGLSTVCFAIIGSEHICVSPSSLEHDRIRCYCREHRISTERIHFIPMKSSAALPFLDTGGRKLDFALIDGAHTFPDPIVDYYYIDEHLKVGGLLAIDDLSISAIGILHKFLTTEPAYRLVEIHGLKTGIYRKVGDTRHVDWRRQAFNRKYPDFSYLPLQVKLRMGLGRLPGLRGAYRLLRAWMKKGC